MVSFVFFLGYSYLLDYVGTLTADVFEFDSIVCLSKIFFGDQDFLDYQHYKQRNSVWQLNNLKTKKQRKSFLPSTCTRPQFVG